MSLTKMLYSLHPKYNTVSYVKCLLPLLHTASLYVFFFNKAFTLWSLPQWVVRLGYRCCPRSGQKRFVEESPLCPPDAKTKPLLLPPSSFTIQGRLMLATPPQLACSLWRGLSGGEHKSTAPCSPNEMPVSEGACGTVKLQKKIIK